MKRVRVQGVGGAILNFPDTMSDEDIQRELDRLLGEPSGPTPTPTTTTESTPDTSVSLGETTTFADTSPEPFGRWSAKATGAMIGKSFSEGAAQLAGGVGGGIDYLARKLNVGGAPAVEGFAGEGLEREIAAPGAFTPEAIDYAVDFWSKNAKVMNEVAVKEGATVADEIVGKAVGGAIPGMSQFMLNVPYSVLTAMAEAEKAGDNELVAGITSGIKRALLGQIFHASQALSPALRVGTLGAVGGIEGYTATGDPMEAAKEAGVMVGMGLLPVPGGARPGMGVRDVARQFKTERPPVDPAEIARERIEEYAKTFEEPAATEPVPAPVNETTLRVVFPGPVPPVPPAEPPPPPAPPPVAPQAPPEVPMTAGPPRGKGKSPFPEGKLPEGYRMGSLEIRDGKWVEVGTDQEYQRILKLSKDILTKEADVTEPFTREKFLSGIDDLYGQRVWDDMVKTGFIEPVIPETPTEAVTYQVAGRKTPEMSPTPTPTLGEIFAPEPDAAQVLTETAPQKVPKGKPEKIRAWTGRLVLDERQWADINPIQNGLGPFFTKKGTGLKAEKKAQEMYEQGMLPDPSVDALVQWLQSRQGRGGALSGTEGGGQRLEYELEIAGQRALERMEAERAEAERIKVESGVVPESAIKPGDQFKIDGEKYKALEYDEDGYLVLKDGQERRVGPGEEIRIDGGMEGIVRTPLEKAYAPEPEPAQVLAETAPKPALAEDVPSGPVVEEIPTRVRKVSRDNTPIFNVGDGRYVVIQAGSPTQQGFGEGKVAAFYVSTNKNGTISLSRYRGVEFGPLESVVEKVKLRAKENGWSTLTEASGEMDWSKPEQIALDILKRGGTAGEAAVAVGKEIGDYPRDDNVQSIVRWAVKELGGPTQPDLIKDGSFRLTEPPVPEGAPKEEFQTPAAADQGLLPGTEKAYSQMREPGVKPPPAPPPEGGLFPAPEPQGEAGLQKTIAEAAEGAPPPKPILGEERGSIGLTRESPRDQGYKFTGSEDQEVATRMSQAEGFDQASFWQRMKDRIKSTAHLFTRAHPELEKTRFARARDILRVYDETVSIAKTYAYEAIKGITGNLGPEKSKLFTQLALLPDLIKDVENGKYAGRVDENGNPMFPFGYKSLEGMRRDLAKYQSELANLPDVQEALTRREATVRRIVEEQVANGLLEPKVLEDPRYYHHQVLELMEVPEGERWKGGPYTGTSSRDVRLHAKGYQIPRKGSAKDYNTRYVEAEFEWMAQAIAELKTKWTLDRLDRTENIAPAVKAEAKRKFGENWQKRWREMIPPGYELWQPDPGNWFYLGRTITEKMLDRFMSDSTLDVQAAFGELPENLIVGQRKNEWVIPSELKRTLNQYRTFEEQNPISRALRSTTTYWKQYTLFNPMRVTKYLINNTTGDLDITIAYDPKILKYVTGSVMRDLFNYSVRRGALPARMMEALERGAINSGITIHEIPDISQSDMINLVTGKKANLAVRYFNKMKDFNTFRENVLRLAAYEYFKDQIAAGRDPVGASNPEEVRQIRDPRDRAAKLSRELIGDYGDISKGGQWLRSHMIPFYSWMEINAPRYYRLLRNAATEGGPSTFGETLAKKGAGSIARFTMQAAAMFGLINAWNMLMYPDENRKLNTQKGQLHLILGRNADTGKVYSIRFQGALSDALQWFGQEAAPMNAKALAEGETTFMEGLKDAAKAPVERVWQSLHPAKSAVETIVGKTTYPNLFSPESFVPGSGARPVRDKAEAMARMFSLDSPYRFLTGKPTRGIGHEAFNVIGATSDPGERAYENIRNKAMEFLEEREQKIPSTSSTPKTLSLYYHKQGMRYGDTKAAEKYLDKYYELGGTSQGMSQSIREGKILNMIPKRLQLDFLESLSPRQIQDLGEADDWYMRTYGE